VGLLTRVLTLPLAPAQGLVWVVGRVVEEAEAELYDEDRIRRQLVELELAFDLGEIGENDYAEREDDLLQRLAIARAREQET
jgi:Gas vesicle protein G